MNHYPKHIGDWMVATAHLSEVEECMYSRMIDAYYARESPLPLDLAAVCRLVRAASAQARKAVETVLHEFFMQEPDGWHQKRCDEELATYREKAAKASRSASIRWSERNANAYANAMRTQCERNANQEPIANSQRSSKALSDSPPEPAAPSDVVPLEVDKTKPPRLASEATEILSFLNARSGRYFRPTPNTLRPIMGRLKEGYTSRECRAVIARKVREWAGDAKWEKYLRPATLFGAEKFSQYVGEVPPLEEIVDVVAS